ncbi:inositol monophosphatase family protein [Halanaerocella petrolearia]
MDLKEVLEQVKNWCREIGKIQVEKMNSNLKVNTKDDEIDLVTEVDGLSEKLILEKIKNNYPEHSILSEESGREEQNSNYRWIIDPIDGTTNYANGFFMFSISIALQFKGEIILGVVYAPKLALLYSAIKGEGAYLNGERINVATTDCLREALLVTGFPYDRASSSDNNIDYFSKLVPKIRGVRRTGSAALDLCSVATGAFDGYWEIKVKIWDMAAGNLIVKEAGGKVITRDKETETEITILAGNNNIVNLISDELELK